MTGLPTARQRTRLARLRTSSGLALLGVYLLRQGLSREAALDVAAAVLVLACAATCTAAVPSHLTALPVTARGPRLLTLAVVVVCVLAFAGALAGRP